MKKWTLLILMLISLSWITSLMEGFLCNEATHESQTEIHSESAPDTDHHSCHAGACHFGHCGHLHARLASLLMREPRGLHAQDSTPYAFILSRTPLFFLMRPPLGFS